MTALWWQRGNVCHDVTNCHADVMLPSCVVTVWATQQRTIQYHQITTRNCPNCAHFSLWNKTFGLPSQKWVQTVALIYENPVWVCWELHLVHSLGWNSYILVVRSNYKPAFWPRLNFYHRWGYLCPHLKCTFQPGVGWKVSSALTGGLSGLEA